MKWIFGSCVIGLCGALVSGGLSGCVAPEGSRSTTVRSSGERPAEVQPKPRSRTRMKQGQVANAITVTKIVPTASPSAQAKGLKTRRKGAPTQTNIPYYFTVDSGFWPTGAESVEAIVKCYEVTTLSTTPAVSVSSTALAVFPNGVTSKSITLTQSATTQVNLNFPTSTAGMTVMVIINGAADNEAETPLSGGDILVVNP
jgi:hypothetical protein